MRLTVVTPLASVLRLDDVVSVQAEDATGSFTILPRHADFLTVLPVSVMSYRRAPGATGHCVLRGGVLRVTGGQDVHIASREAVPGDDLERLEHEVLARFASEREEELSARAASKRAQLATMRLVLGYARAERPALDRLVGDGMGRP